MKEITRDEYNRIVEWVKGANNYTGVAPHNVDGVAHCIRNDDGRTIIVVEECADDFSDRTIYMVNEAVYKVWRAKHGYTITL
ncbi:MAG: hypothetical protein ACWGQW_01460 [bacterium]